MANEKIDGQDRMNQYDGEEYEDSSSSSMSMDDSVSLYGVGSEASSSSSRENNESRREIGLTECVQSSVQVTGTKGSMRPR
nr:hypothetical protein CFP56_53985 [Quercus suber]